MFNHKLNIKNKRCLPFSVCISASMSVLTTYTFLTAKLFILNVFKHIMKQNEVNRWFGGKNLFLNLFWFFLFFNLEQIRDHFVAEVCSN